MLPDCQQSLRAPIAVHPRPAVDRDGVNWPLAGPARLRGTAGV